MSHYEKGYFDWQKDYGKFGGLVETFKFQPFIQPGDNVIDFGAGGGFLLNNLRCKGKMGLEINDSARAQSQALGVDSVKSVHEIPDNWADVIISNHALEHTFQPLDEIRSLYPKLKKGGKILFCVPLEKVNHYKPNDINQHLYTWSEMNLGNLFTLAGYHVISVKEIKYKWPPYFWIIRQKLGKFIFDLSCKIWARYKWKISQVMVVAEKSNAL